MAEALCNYGIIPRADNRGTNTMREEQEFTRRKFISTTAKTVATIPVVALLGEQALGEEAGAAAKLDESNPTAVALGYKHDANDVDVDRFAKRATEEGKKQFCDNCLHYKPSDEEGWGPCAIFPGFNVAAKGWCNVWVKATT